MENTPLNKNYLSDKNPMPKIEVQLGMPNTPSIQNYMLYFKLW